MNRPSLDRTFSAAVESTSRTESELVTGLITIGASSLPGRPGDLISFPTYQYRGLLEEITPTSTQDATRKAYCAGVVTDAKMDYLGVHLTTDGQAKDDVTRWLGDRFAGKTTRGNC